MPLVEPLAAVPRRAPAFPSLPVRCDSTAPPGVPDSLWRTALLDPTSEFLSRPGKCIRGRTLAASWSLAGGVGEAPAVLTDLVEMLHAGSLIVDDIEDDSLQRRGRAALHRLIGVPAALNLGNWLYFRALDTLRELGLAATVERDCHRLCLDAIRVCHEGQALDLAARIGDLHPRDVVSVCRVISERKTGALMAMASELGAVAAGADERKRTALRDYGVRLGVALQMLNDLGELSGSAGPIKHPEDMIHGRVTWPWAWAAERLPAARFDALQVRGAKLAAGVGDAAALARDLLAALGPDPARIVQTKLDDAHRDVSASVGPHPVLIELQDEAYRLLRSIA